VNGGVAGLLLDGDRQAGRQGVEVHLFISQSGVSNGEK